MKQITLIPILAVLCVAPIAQSCSTQEETKTVERTTTTDRNPEPQESTTITTTTRTTTETSEKEPDSVLGATAHAIGTVILFPFRLIGDALGLLV